MSTISVEEIDRDPRGFLRRMVAGEEMLVTRNQRPLAQVKPVAGTAFTGSAELRPFGLSAGQFTVPEDFDSALPDDVLSDFEGK